MRSFEPHYGRKGTLDELQAQVANIHRYLIELGHDSTSAAQQNQGAVNQGTAVAVSGIGAEETAVKLAGDVTGPENKNVAVQASGAFSVLGGDLTVANGIIQETITDAGTVNTLIALILRHLTTAAAAAGLGVELDFVNEVSSGGEVVTGWLQSQYTGGGAGVENGSVTFGGIYTGARCEVARFRGGIGPPVGTVSAGVGGQFFVRTAVLLGAGSAGANSAPLTLTTGALLTSPEAGAVEYLAPTFTATPVATRRAISLASNTLTADVTVANTVTETLLYTGTIAANEMAAGKKFRVELDGMFSGLVTDTVTFRFKMGGTTFLTITSVAAAITNALFQAEFVLTCRTTGAAGTVISSALVAANNVTLSAVDTATHTVDTTTAENISVTVQWSAASASDTLTLQQGSLELLN